MVSATEACTTVVLNATCGSKTWVGSGVKICMICRSRGRCATDSVVRRLLCCAIVAFVETAFVLVFDDTSAPLHRTLSILILLGVRFTPVAYAATYAAVKAETLAVVPNKEKQVSWDPLADVLVTFRITVVAYDSGGDGGVGDGGMGEGGGGEGAVGGEGDGDGGLGLRFRYEIDMA